MPDKIILIEDHHEALREWRKLKIKDAFLIHLDAHVDFGFYKVKPTIKAFKEARDLVELKEHLERSLLFRRYKINFEDQLNIGNYIYPAIRDGIVKSFHWIIPGGEKEFNRSKKILRRIMKNLKTKDPCQHSDKLYNRKFLITDICSVIRYNLPVILDIDLDYMLFDSLKDTSLSKNISKRKPWIYPDRFVKLLRNKFPIRICTTIAYSVNGGFTPISYKFFGDEIKFRFRNVRINQRLEKVFVLRNNAIASYYKNELDKSFKCAVTAVRFLKDAVNLDKAFKRKFLAHLYFWIYNICWNKNKKEEARLYYVRALRNDSTLRVADNNFGWLYMSSGKIRAARREFERIVFCDNLDYNALRGLGDLNFFSKRYIEARKRYCEALKLKPDDKAALIGIAECCLRLSDFKGSENILRKLKGIDSINSRVYRIKAEIFTKKGDYKKSLTFYKEAVISGSNTPDMYREISRILKIEKDKDLSDFFRNRYNAVRRKRS